METIKFKTNIKCAGCLAQVSQVLNETVGNENWSVDLNSAEKTLSVHRNVIESDIVVAINKAGFTAERV